MVVGEIREGHPPLWWKMGGSVRVAGFTVGAPLPAQCLFCLRGAEMSPHRWGQRLDSARHRGGGQHPVGWVQGGHGRPCAPGLAPGGPWLPLLPSEPGTPGLWRRGPGSKGPAVTLTLQPIPLTPLDFLALSQVSSQSDGGGVKGWLIASHRWVTTQASSLASHPERLLGPWAAGRGQMRPCSW